MNALTMAPARAVQLIRPPAEHGGEEREALPRLGIALIFGFLAYRFLTPMSWHRYSACRAWSLAPTRE